MIRSKTIHFILPIVVFVVLIGLQACNLPQPDAEDVVDLVGEAVLPEEYEDLPDGMMETATAAAMMLEIPDTPEIPEVPTLESQEPTVIGPGVPGFPEGTPIPAGWKPINVPPMLEADGYVIAYHFDGVAEEVARDLSAVMVFTGTWMIDQLRSMTYSSTYVLPFGNISTGFIAHAYITSNPDAINIDSIDGTIVALKTGQYE
jgi:hypothetical protein